MQLFFARKNADGFFLDEKESHHCLHVLRKNQKDEIFFTDGAGNLFRGTIQIEKKIIRLNQPELLRHTSSPMPCVHLAVAPTKQFQRMEWMLEKITEIGVNKISFLQTERTERFHFSIDRCASVLINAMKQSLSLHIPELSPPVKLDNFLNHLQETDNLFKGICHASNKGWFISEIPDTMNYLFLIGPEGDFTPDEILMAIHHGFQIVSLGYNRLRTETAGVFAVSAIRSKKR